MAKEKNLVNLKCQRIFAVWIKKTITIFDSVLELFEIINQKMLSKLG